MLGLNVGQVEDHSSSRPRVERSVHGGNRKFSKPVLRVGERMAMKEGVRKLYIKWWSGKYRTQGICVVLSFQIIENV